MGLFSSDIPAVVKKWLPRELRRDISRYRPGYITPETNIRVLIDVLSPYPESETSTLLTFEYRPFRIVEWLNPIFGNAEMDWKELVEVAAWLIRMENPEHIALAKQMMGGLGHGLLLLLQHDKCAVFQRRHSDGPLRMVAFS